MQETERCNFKSRNAQRKSIEIYHINDLFNLFPYYDFGENYRGNDQSDFLQSSC